MDQIILFHGVLLAVFVIAILITAALVAATAIHVHANKSIAVPRDPLEGIEFRR